MRQRGSLWKNYTAIIVFALISLGLLVVMALLLLSPVGLTLLDGEEMPTWIRLVVAGVLVVSLLVVDRQVTGRRKRNGREA